MGEKHLVDTSILIPFYNRGFFEEKILEISGRGEVLFSAVSINEFVRGAHDRVSKRIVREFLDIASSGTVTPTAEQWIECGLLSEKILKGKRRSKEGVLLLQNDILIALGARDADAVLVTADVHDFSLIREFMNVSIDFWRPHHS